MELIEIQHRAVEIRKKYHLLEKQKYGRSWTKEEVSMGLVGDVGDLLKLVMSLSGIREIKDAESKFKHELCDILWATLVLANFYNVDLESEFLLTMEELENSIDTELR